MKADSPSGTAHSIAIAAARGEGGHFTARATVGENQAVAGGAIDCFLETISELIGATVDGTTGVRMRVVALRGSSTPFCRSESRPHDTLVAKPASVPQPTVALDTACSQNRPVSPHRYVGCAPDIHVLRQPHGLKDCHTLCPDTGVGVLPQWAVVVRPQWRLESPPTSWHHGRWLQQP